jgi:hypothetical protein
VANIVEKANKELGIEKTLTKIIDVWEGMQCSYALGDARITELGDINGTRLELGLGASQTDS